jgi:hypothetical protein
MQSLGLIMHELATNATKHVEPRGHDRGRLEPREGAAGVRLTWQERGVDIGAVAPSGGRFGAPTRGFNPCYFRYLSRFGGKRRCRLKLR